MFQVGRFDPREEERKKKKRKAISKDSEDKKKSSSKKKHGKSKLAKSQEAPSIKVIAPETTGPSSSEKMLLTKASEEAFNDLDIIEDVPDKLNPNTANDETQAEESVPDPNNHVEVALNLSKKSIKDAASMWNLAPFLIKNLEEDGYKNFFPIQALVIPDVIATERHAHIQARDICVAAPTGSGKTLAFVLPVLNSLANRQIRRLRALVVLPSRDLAKQVYEVFDRYTSGSDLKVELAVGQSDFTEEQKQLTVGTFDERTCISDPLLAKMNHHFAPLDIDKALDTFSQNINQTQTSNLDSILPLGGLSSADILVCTPGRLVDHLDNTPGFTLQHLRFLVIDEADRLLNQSYHGWINRVTASANSASVKMLHSIRNADGNDEEHSEQVDPITWRRSALHDRNHAVPCSIPSICQPIQLRKLLYSATMTKDPQKLAPLQLVNPQYVDAHHLSSSSQQGGGSHLYTMPDNLEECTVECTAEQKPIALLAILLEQIRSNPGDIDEKHIVVVFTSSLESTHRLARLLQLLWKAAKLGESNQVAEFSSALSQTERSELIVRCRDPKDVISIVVCSDGMSRGMDIASVSCVVNYDVPGFAKTYVHRAGRTARAGRSGKAITLLKGGQVGQFGKMRQLITEPERVRMISVNMKSVLSAIPVYKTCVAALRQVLDAEEDGDLRHTDDDLTEWA